MLLFFLMLFGPLSCKPTSKVTQAPLYSLIHSLIHPTNTDPALTDEGVGTSGLEELNLVSVFHSLSQQPHPALEEWRRSKDTTPIVYLVSTC